jgi:hypothetical protein
LPDSGKPYALELAEALDVRGIEVRVEGLAPASVARGTEREAKRAGHMPALLNSSTQCSVSSCLTLLSVAASPPAKQQTTAPHVST